MLKTADMLQAEGLFRHCLEAFGGGLTVHTAIEHLVWAQKHGPEGARGLTIAYVVQHIKTIQVTELLVMNAMLVHRASGADAHRARCSLTGFGVGRERHRRLWICS